jgi:hypothetical protein
MSERHTLLLGRIVALAAGLAILLGAAVTSFGVALSAPVGIWLVHRFQRARGRTLGAGDSWIGAVSGAIVTLLVIAGVVATMLPSGSWHQMRQVADSASTEAAKRPPPAWLSRVAPTAGRPMPGLAKSPAFNAVTMIWGMGFAVGILGGLVGTIAWVGAMLLIFSASGHWLGRPPDAGIVASGGT